MNFERIILNFFAGAVILLSLCSFTQPPASTATATADQSAKKKKGKEPIELPDMSHSGFKVSGGQIVQQDSSKLKGQGSIADSLGSERPDSLEASEHSDSVFTTIIRGDSVVVKNDTLTLLTGNFEVAKPDTVKRDTTLMGLSYMTLISAAVPGFGQFYNKDYWKIPIFWAAIGTPLYFGIRQHKIYSNLKNEYETLLAMDAPRSQVDPVQRNMILHNTWRQLFFGGAIAAYIYTLYDAVTNYPAKTERIRMATTLSFVCPGLGQLYNGSYWKIPLFVGGFATFGYMIDWNNRGYVRFERALKLRPNDEFHGSRGESELKNMRDAYRRNRDLCIIIAAAWYFINVLDAHVDAQLKDYDISDDLARRLTIEPIIAPMYASNSMSYGIGIGWRF